MLEKQIETAFVKATHQRGGLCLKFISPSTAGVPDRLVLLPDGHMGFVEMKAPGKRPPTTPSAKAKPIKTTWLPGLCL